MRIKFCQSMNSLINQSILNHRLSQAEKNSMCF